MMEPDFLETFLSEASETLDAWEASCLRLEKAPTPENLDDLFRRAHNLKGSAKSVGLLDLGNLVHQAEDLITRLRNRELNIGPTVISALLECQKFLSHWIQQLQSSPEYNPDVQPFVNILLPFKAVTETSAPAESLGFEIFDDSATSTPSTPVPSTNNNDIGNILISSGDVTQQQIELAITQQQRKLGQVLVDNGIVSREQVDAALEKQKHSGHKPDETIRVSLKKLDSMVRLISELSIQVAIIRNAKESELLGGAQAAEAIDLAAKVTQDLHTEAMAMRMQPLEGLFQRLERVCRDIGREQKKSIQVILKGAEVELDKSVIEKMKDPLVHILRNAVDHGIETTTEREQTEKNAVANITIEGIQTAANVVIKISDDGRGLSLDRIRKKAIEKGLIAANATLSDDEIRQLIFIPGFSTAEKITDVSGRGVGMDVVKQTVNELRGSIWIESEFGAGTEFSINLPSTLSIIDAVVIGLGDSLYAVPIQDVDEVVDMSTIHSETIMHPGRAINLRGRILPITRLSQFLPRPQGDQVHNSSPIAIVSSHNANTVAFEVDRVAGQQSIVVRKLEDKLAAVPGFSGGTILSSGEPSMIVDMQQIVKTYLASVKAEAS